MKNQIAVIIAILTIALPSLAQVGIGIDNPHPSAALQLEATDKALLMPRLSGKDVLTDPVDGMIFFNESLDCLVARQNAEWIELTPCSANTEIIQINVESIVVNSLSSDSPNIIGTTPDDGESYGTIDVEVTTTAPTPYSFRLLSPNHPNMVFTASGFLEAGTNTVTLTVENGVDELVTFYSGSCAEPWQANIIGANNWVPVGFNLFRITNDKPSNTWVEGVDFNDIVSTTSGRTWMDRDLGSFSQLEASLYQWGRPEDGHEQMKHYKTAVDGTGPRYGTTTTLSPSDTPNHQQYIISTGDDWMATPNDDRWNTTPQGPCPTGYRLPTLAEFKAEEIQTTFFGPIIKISPTFYNRIDTDGTYTKQPACSGSFITGTRTPCIGENCATYWTSELDGTKAVAARYTSGDGGFFAPAPMEFISVPLSRATALPVRCIKN